MGKKLLGIKYLQCSHDIDSTQEIDQQILERIYTYYEEISLGYKDPGQKAKLISNGNTIRNTLCFVQKHWKTLLRVEFPNIPDGADEFLNSKLLEALCSTVRNKKNRVSLSQQELCSHISFLGAIRWNDFAVPAFKEAVAGIKDEIEKLTDLLTKHQKYLKDKVKEMKSTCQRPSTSTNKKRKAVAAFKKSIGTVTIADDEFHAVVDSAFKKSRPRGRLGKFAMCVMAAVDKVISDLRERDGFTVMPLTDKVMQIDKFADQQGEDIMSSLDRARCRQMFRTEISLGISRMKIHIFGKLHSGSKPACIFV
mmetsp:Transcript_516/g.1047  ORF Transcript_516/g.1047 Transcript_516/m.1047 type:complete len:309 (-) Transcript_516:517-1443(-)